jgi:ADP-ribose pyrophosphatase YjhB (NUDIX family)
MVEIIVPHWLKWAREIQALAQTGIHYAVNDFDRERYRRLSEIAAEIISSHSNLDKLLLEEVFTTQIGYATPRIDVRGVVFNKKELLLVRERSDGKWTLPGGWADVGDIPSQAAEREVREEAGFTVKAKKVIGVYDANRSGPLELFHAFKIIFLCDLLTGEATPSTETSEVGFFAKVNIPMDLSYQRTNSRFIQDAFNALEFPDVSTVFD